MAIDFSFLKHICILILLLMQGVQLQAQEHKSMISGFSIGISSHYYPYAPNFFYLLTRRTPYIGENGYVTTYDRDPHASRRLELSADLFDGHIQTWYSIGLGRGAMKKDILNHSFEFPFAAGVRYYPWSILRNKVTPYFGCATMPMRFRQMGLDDRITSATTILNSLDFGISLNGPWVSAYLGFAYFLDNTFMINLNETKRVRMDVAAWIPTFNLSYRLPYKQGTPHEVAAPGLERPLHRPSAQGLFVGGGMAFRHSTGATAFMETALPFMDPHAFSGYFPVSQLGYVTSTERWFLMLDYGRYTMSRKNIGYELRYEDQYWRGFLSRYIVKDGDMRPFLGLGLSTGKDKLTVWHNGLPIEEYNDDGGSIHFMAGMDLVLSKTSDWLRLRTFCTYNTGTFYDYEDQDPRMGSLEWSIQVLVFPFR